MSATAHDHSGLTINNSIQGDSIQNNCDDMNIAIYGITVIYYDGVLELNGLVDLGLFIFST